MSTIDELQRLHERKFRAECALGNLHRVEFINPNEGMLL